MRFIENGPNIPESLLKAQEEGNVVFICGAGVSKPAGLPNFNDLTINVARKLGAEEVVENLISGDVSSESYDVIFRRLANLFGKSRVDFEVSNALKANPTATLLNHANIIKLSKNSHGNPQIVTTNFDLLFEKCSRKIRTYVPPYLPDLSFTNGFEGLIYLHGRLVEGEQSKPRNYIIDSSDFGRAYLAEGWATKFIKDLQSNYCVVIIGYSGDDPPMKYLLEGLANASASSNTPPIYSFVKNESNEIEKWHNRGVIPIPFDSYSSLWDSIDLWAQKSANVERWTTALLSKTQKSPRYLKPFERGQIVRFVMTKEGAKLFSEQKKPPSAEWLCVFDCYLRYTILSESEIDRIYALDDDPPYVKEDISKPRRNLGIDALSWCSTDELRTDSIQLGFWNTLTNGNLPMRLHYLSVWLTKILEQPFVMWWASSKICINPNLIFLLKQSLHSRVIPKRVQQFWNYYIGSKEHGVNTNNDFDWFDFLASVKTFGWCTKTIADFERLLTPYVEFNNCKYNKFGKKLGKNGCREFVDVKVAVRDFHDENLEIPDNLLTQIIGAVRKSLERICNLNEELDLYQHHMSSLFPEGISEFNHYDSKELVFRLLVKIFDKLILFDSKRAYLEFCSWRKDENIFFAKLRLYAVSKPSVVPANEIGQFFGSLSDEIFWGFYNQRELLFAIRNRWSDLAIYDRTQILKRFFKGRPKYRGITLQKYRQVVSQQCVMIILWLKNEGCDIEKKVFEKIIKLKNELNDWRDEWVANAASSHDMVSGTVRLEINPACLLDTPISEVILTAEENSKSFGGELLEKKPFEGLVKERPVKAYLALKFNLKQGDFQKHYWDSFLSGYDKFENTRFNYAIAVTLLDLSVENLAEIMWQVIHWFDKISEKLMISSPDLSFKLIDRILLVISSMAEGQLKSNIISIGSKSSVRRESQVSRMKSLNSKGGWAVRSLLNLLGKESIAIEVKTKILATLAQLITLNGNAGDHATSSIMEHFDYLFWNYKEWTKSNLIPIFDIRNSKSEAAWHGITGNSSILSDEAFILIRDSFIQVLTGKTSWEMDDSEMGFLFQILVWRTKESPPNSAFITFQETRNILKSCSEKHRNSAIDTVCRRMSKSEDWENYIKPFLKNAWPQEIKFISQHASRAMVDLADKAKENFPDIVANILPFLTKVEHSHAICSRYYAEKNLENAFDVARIYPNETLQLLSAIVPDDRYLAPFALDKTLSVIAEAEPSLKRTPKWKQLYRLTV